MVNHLKKQQQLNSLSVNLTQKPHKNDDQLVFPVVFRLKPSWNRTFRPLPVCTVSYIANCSEHSDYSLSAFCSRQHHTIRVHSTRLHRHYNDWVPKVRLLIWALSMSQCAAVTFLFGTTTGKACVKHLRFPSPNQGLPWVSGSSGQIFP